MSLVDEKTQKLESASKEKDEAWTRAYMEALINPFSHTIALPKILDGEVRRSAAMKLRATGEIICSPVHNTNIILFPALTNVICWCTEPDGSFPDVPNHDRVLNNSAVFRNHLSTEEGRSNVRLCRLVGAGLRLWLTNPAEEDDGYWEACRINSQVVGTDITFFDNPPDGTNAKVLKALDMDYDMVNNSTYQFGQLRDVNKHIFKLNSTDNQHKFSALTGLNGRPKEPGPADSDPPLDDTKNFDMIFIKIRGRRNAATPSVLRFDTIANQELVFSEETQFERLMEKTVRIPNIEGFLEHSSVDKPSFQVS